MDIKQAASAYSNIAGIQPGSSDPAQQTPDASFETLLENALGGAVDKAHGAEKVSALALAGKSDLTDLVTAVGSAELALNTVVAIRDKVVSAYQQIMQMPM
jgi:flagellar hook-basal body complex protein FliE